MTTAATSLLGLALPVTGELSGTWGDTVNNSITALLDSAVAGTTTLSADADVTLTTTTLAANQAREAIILWTAAGTVTRNITAPAQSKTYVVLNKSSTQSIVIRGAGPTTGVTVLAGKQAMVAWDGTDFVEVSSGYVDGPASSTDNAVARFDGTDGKLIQNSVVIIADTTGNMSGVGTLGVGAITTSGALVGTASQDAFNTVSTTLNLGGAATTVNIGAATGTLTVANATLAAKAVTATSLTNSALTATRLVYSGTAGLEVDSANLTFNGTILTSTGFAGPLNGTVGATTANTGAFTTLTTSSTVTLSGGTANGVAYLNGSKVLTTGSALTFDGTNFKTTGGVYSKTGTANAGVVDGTQLYPTTSSLNSFGAIYGDSNGGTGLEAYGQSHATNPSVIVFKSSGEQMRLISTGLGIGTSSPGTKLEVFQSQNATTRIQVNNQDSGASALSGLSLQAYGGGWTIDVPASTTFVNPLLFKFNGTEHVRIDSSGNLGVGTTLANSGITLFPGFSSAGSSGIDIKHVSTAATGEYYITFQYNGGVIGSITQAGTTGVLYNVTSDYRLKTVIGAVADSGSRIDALQPVEYTWNADGSRTRGFLAHQFQEVYASSVSGTKDAVDADGKPVYQAMQAATSEVIADLVAEIQDLRKRLAAAGIA